MLSADDRLFFIHIPKTAGTTLIPLIDMHFHEREICPAQLWRELVRLPQQNLLGYRLFRGHFGGDGLATFLPRPPVCMTMLRDPIALSISTFKFIQREPGTRMHKLVNETRMDLRAFLEHPETRGKVSNKQTRHLSFSLQHDPDTGPIFMHEESLAAVDGWVRDHRVRIRPKLRLQRAMEKLQSCAFFGLVERFEESIALMCHTFGWPPVGPVQKLMVAPQEKHRGDEAESALQQRLVDINEQDVELYRFAERLLDERLAAMRANLCLDDSNESVHVRLDRQYRARRVRTYGIDGATYRRIDLDEPLFGDGWHRRELSSLDGTTFRWTGPGALSTMDLASPAAGDDCRITIRLINALSQEIYDSFRLRANGVDVPLRCIDGRSSVRILQGVIPRAALADELDGVLRLEFRVDRTTSPRDLDASSADTRQVGVALNWLDLAPATTSAAGSVPHIELKPDEARALRARRKIAVMERLKQRIAGIPVVGPRLRRAYIRFKSR